MPERSEGEPVERTRGENALYTLRHQRCHTIATSDRAEDTPFTLSVRRFQRRSLVPAFLHGFPLAQARVSPAVKHGAPPPEAMSCLVLLRR